MASAIGGSIESMSIKNRLFSVASDADVSRSLGGFNNEVQMNGDGTGRMVKSVVSWMLDGVQVECNNLNSDLEFLQQIADENEFVPFVITYVDGTSYQGTGMLEGELNASSQTATATISIRGVGKLEQQ